MRGGRTLNSFRQALYFQDIGFLVHDVMIYEKTGSPFPGKNRYTQIYEFMVVLSKGKPKTYNLIKDKPNKWAGTKNWATRSERVGDELVTKKDVVVKDMGARTNIWKIINSYGFGTKDKFAHEHPATFPEAIPNDHIITWTNEGDWVLDPMCGSGTTCKMALLNKRNFIGIDIDKKYIEISKERIKNVK